MKTATALILEASDFTKDLNLKKEAFSAFAKAELVIHEGRVIKTGAALLPQAPQEPVKRVRRVKAPQAARDAPQAPTERFATQALEASLTGNPPSFDDISSES